MVANSPKKSATMVPLYNPNAPLRHIPDCLLVTRLCALLGVTLAGRPVIDSTAAYRLETGWGIVIGLVFSVAVVDHRFQC